MGTGQGLVSYGSGGPVKTYSLNIVENIWYYILMQKCYMFYLQDLCWCTMATAQDGSNCFEGFQLVCLAFVLCIFHAFFQLTVLETLAWVSSMFCSCLSNVHLIDQTQLSLETCGGPSKSEDHKFIEINLKVELIDITLKCLLRQQTLREVDCYPK